MPHIWFHTLKLHISFQMLKRFINTSSLTMLHISFHLCLSPLNFEGIILHRSLYSFCEDIVTAIKERNVFSLRSIHPCDVGFSTSMRYLSSMPFLQCKQMQANVKSQSVHIYCLKIEYKYWIYLSMFLAYTKHKTKTCVFRFLIGLRHPKYIRIGNFPPKWKQIQDPSESIDNNKNK